MSLVKCYVAGALLFNDNPFYFCETAPMNDNISIAIRYDENVYSSGQSSRNCDLCFFQSQI